MVKNLLKTVLIGTAISWLAHKGYLPIAAPWHEYVPFAFLTSLLATIVATPEGAHAYSDININSDMPVKTINDLSKGSDTQ